MRFVPETQQFLCSCLALETVNCITELMFERLLFFIVLFFPFSIQDVLITKATAQVLLMNNFNTVHSCSGHETTTTELSVKTGPLLICEGHLRN